MKLFEEKNKNKELCLNVLMSIKKESNTNNSTFLNYINNLSPVHSRQINYSKIANAKSDFFSPKKNEKTQKNFTSIKKHYYDMEQLTINQNTNMKKWNSHILNNFSNSNKYNKKDIINLKYFKKEPKDTIRIKLFEIKGNNNDKPTKKDNISINKSMINSIKKVVFKTPLNSKRKHFKQNKIIKININEQKNHDYTEKYPSDCKSNCKSKIISINSNLNLSEFTKINQIGKGTYGKIFSVVRKINNKKYALKKEIIKDIQYIEKRKNTIKIINDFIEKTKSKGVIKIYSNLFVKYNDKYIYYELMEIGEYDWEKDINERRISISYYTETELLNISSQLIKTLSLLQKNHITHRDIKPHNILIINGKYKLCDYGEIRIIKKDGLIVQRIRGSELYMSPILFYGLKKKLIQVRHNTYKSDVFSLGMCLFYAATLYYNCIDEIREITDVNKMYILLNKYLSKRYGKKIISLIYLMLQIKEDLRPDFIELEKKLDNILIQ